MGLTVQFHGAKPSTCDRHALDATTLERSTTFPRPTTRQASFPIPTRISATLVFPIVSRREGTHARARTRRGRTDGVRCTALCSAIDEAMMTAVVMMMTVIERCQYVMRRCLMVAVAVAQEIPVGKLIEEQRKTFADTTKCCSDLIRSIIDHIAFLIPRALLELVYFPRISDLDIYCCRSAVRRPPRRRRL